MSEVTPGDNIRELIAEARKFDTVPAEYAVRLLGAHDLIDRLADALVCRVSPVTREALNYCPKHGDLLAAPRSKRCLEDALGHEFLSVSPPAPATREALDVRTELRRLADVAEGSAAWTENNFLPGPNSSYSIRHNREMAEWLREAADESLSVFPPAEVEYRRVMPDGRPKMPVVTFETMPALDEGWTAEYREPGPWVPVTPGEGKGQ